MRRAPSQDSFGLAALRTACRDSDEGGAAAEPASCATGVRHAQSEPLCSAKPAARLDSPTSKAGHPRKAAAALRRPLTQLHLDLGQVIQHAPKAELAALTAHGVLCCNRQDLSANGMLSTCVGAGQLREHHVQRVRHDVLPGPGERREAARRLPQQPPAGHSLPGELQLVEGSVRALTQVAKITYQYTSVAQH